MQVTAYLVIQGKKSRTSVLTYVSPGTIRITKTKPKTEADEIAIKLSIDVPDALFFKPSLTAQISIQGDQVIGHDITCEIRDNIAQAIRDASGMNVHLVVGEDPTP